MGIKNIIGELQVNGSPVITQDDLSLLPSGLPEYSEENNGQFLRVVNGEPTWETVPNAEEATF